MKTDIGFIKDLLLQMNKKTPSVVGDHSVNKNEKPWEEEEESGETEEDKDVPLHSWVKKVELPTFEGHDPLGWLARAEKFFEVQQVKPLERLRLAFISMEGNAIRWFQYWRLKFKNLSWKEFADALIRRFGGNRRGPIYERLASLRQTGGVEEYVQEFELLVVQAKPSAEDQILGYFLAGLRQDIRSLVCPHDPRDLTRAMEVACDVEEAMKQMRSYGS